MNAPTPKAMMFPPGFVEGIKSEYNLAMKVTAGLNAGELERLNAIKRARGDGYLYDGKGSFYFITDLETGADYDTRRTFNWF